MDAPAEMEWIKSNRPRADWRGRLHHLSRRSAVAFFRFFGGGCIHSGINVECPAGNRLELVGPEFWHEFGPLVHRAFADSNGSAGCSHAAVVPFNIFFKHAK